MNTLAHIPSHGEFHDDHEPVFSPSESFQDLGLQPLEQPPIRFVSRDECATMKSNIIRVLREHQLDVSHSFSLSEFTVIFQQILPEVQQKEITKLFSSIAKSGVLAFDAIINDQRNFNELLGAIGCHMAMDDYLASPDDHKQQASKPSVTFEANVNAGNYVE